VTVNAAVIGACVGCGVAGSCTGVGAEWEVQATANTRQMSILIEKSFVFMVFLLCLLILGKLRALPAIYPGNEPHRSSQASIAWICPIRYCTTNLLKL
jgi:hypothetical protein